MRDWVEEQLGGPVTDVEDRVGGFAPGCAAVVATAERSAFCKATGSLPNAFALELYRGERARLAALPDRPALPKPLAAVDLELADQEWAVTLLPALPGEPPQHPWSEAVAGLVLDRLGDLQVRLTEVAGAEQTAALPGSEHLTGFLRPWSEVFSVHADLRADNVIVAAPAAPGREPRVWFVDWAAALRAAPWVDPAILACDFAVSRADHSQGGPMDVAGFLASHPVTAAVEPALRWAMMTGLAVTPHRLSRQPDPPGLPTLRRWQARCADDLLGFVRAVDLGSGHRVW